MNRLSLFCVAALLGAAVSAPAQFSVEARIGRHVRGSVTLGQYDHGHHRQTAWCEPVRRLPCPAPVVVRGRWETICEQVLVPGCWRDEHVPPTYGWVYSSCGHRRWDIVDHGGCRRVWVPQHYEQRSRRVWVGC